MSMIARRRSALLRWMPRWGRRSDRCRAGGPACVAPGGNTARGNTGAHPRQSPRPVPAAPPAALTEALGEAAQSAQTACLGRR